MQDSINQFGEEDEFTKLVVDLKGKDPDDAFSSIPYEKGFVFLYHLEKLVGKEKWDQFIPHVSIVHADTTTHTDHSVVFQHLQVPITRLLRLQVYTS